MSTASQLRAEVIKTTHQVDQELTRLNGYKRNLDDAQRQISAALAGSTQQYEQSMLSQVSTTQQKVDDAIAKLTAAKERLIRVSTI